MTRAQRNRKWVKPLKLSHEDAERVEQAAVWLEKYFKTYTCHALGIGSDLVSTWEMFCGVPRAHRGGYWFDHCGPHDLDEVGRREARILALLLFLEVCG